MPSVSALYRPQTFADVTGQDSVKETLRLEVESGKIGHAYLFSGPRGIGKTTTARIFAKALNCLHPKNGEPDNSCESCVEATNGRSLDVIEMDAATHNGVDNVREAIVEHVRYAPHRKHKIYIMDEAQMITGPAWNALLKTIEEPPPYAVFLFLTTELHKIPATIQSRCQRFDFKRIADEQMTERVTMIAKKENIELAPEVVKTIVAKSDGCLRDAESFLGQLLALGEKKITMDVASLVLPVSRLPIAAEILETWATRQLGPALARIEELETQGIALLPLFDDLISAARFLLLASDSVATRQKLASGDDGEKKLATLVSTYEPAELSDMALLLMERRRDAKQGADARFCLELAASAVCLSLLPHGQSVSTPKTSPPAPSPSLGEGKLNLRKVEVGNDAGAQFVAPAVTEPRGVINHAPTSQTDKQGISLSTVQSKWLAFLRLMEERSKSLTFVLKITKPVAIEGFKLILEFAYSFHKEKILDDMKSRKLVIDTLREATGISNLEVDGTVSATSGGDVTSVSPAESKDMVTNILKAFGGAVVGDSS